MKKLLPLITFALGFVCGLVVLGRYQIITAQQDGLTWIVQCDRLTGKTTASPVNLL